MKRTLLPTIQFKKFNRALCVLDPYGLHLDLGSGAACRAVTEAVDLFIDFPVMDMNRNAIWRMPEQATPEEGIERMNRFWGDKSWKQAAYAKSDQGNFFPRLGLSNRTTRRSCKLSKSNSEKWQASSSSPILYRCGIGTTQLFITCSSLHRNLWQRRLSRTFSEKTQACVMIEFGPK